MHLHSPDFLYSQGLIPGPEESEEHFAKRVETSLKNCVDPSLWKECWEETEKRWKFKICWVPITFSTKELHFWEAAVTWREEDALFLHLHPRLQQGSFWGYSRKEILLHESIHILRASFEKEYRFEEHLAYLSSSKSWVAFLGPLINSSKDMLCIFAAIIALLFSSYFFSIPLWSYFLPFLPFFPSFLYRRYILKKCRKKIPLPLLFLLSDKEIYACAKAKQPVQVLKNASLLRQKFFSLFYTL
mgnify:CR=1 FL=1